MNSLKGRAERHHVEVRIFFKEEAALETCMNSFDGGFDTIKFFICFRSDLHDLRVHVGSPSGITVSVAYFRTCKSEESLNLIGNIPLARLDRRTLAGGDDNLIGIFHRD